MDDKKCLEFAKETLKLLSQRRLPPTPVNYKRVYNEVAGIPSVEPFPVAELKGIAQALPAKTPGQQKQRGLLEYSIDRMHWEGVKAALVAYGTFTPTSDHAAGFAPTTLATPAPKSPVQETSGLALTNDFLAQIAKLIEYAQPALPSDDSYFANQTSQLIQALRATNIDIAAIKTLLPQYTHRLSFVAEEQGEIKAALLRLLHLVFENIASLSLDEQWFAGQMRALMEVAKPPLSLRRLDDLGWRLKDVIGKQAQAKEKAVQAQEDMRQMLVAFIERLSKMTQSAGSFQNNLEESARLIENAKSMEEIAPVLRSVVNTTRNMAEESQSVQEELSGMRERASKSDAELAKLHQELDKISLQARHDPLTGALNRKGLEEALEREIAVVRRKETPLSMALIDIDNFKKINDQRGHAVGDDALKHLATVVRECMRPQDTLARYGGEEFVILLPDTPLDKGVEAITRLQRELSTRLFLAGEDKVLITFSAGVAQLAESELGMQAIKRADQTMYLAKRSGKNRVFGA